MPTKDACQPRFEDSQKTIPHLFRGLMGQVEVGDVVTYWYRAESRKAGVFMPTLVMTSWFQLMSFCVSG